MFAPGQEVYYNSALGQRKVFGIVATPEQVEKRYRNEPNALVTIRKAYPDGVVFAYWNGNSRISYMPTGSVFSSVKNYTPEQSGDTDEDV
jgi:hypothetical protein